MEVNLAPIIVAVILFGGIAYVMALHHGWKNVAKIFVLWVAVGFVIYLLIALGLPAVQKALTYLGSFLP